MAAEIRFECKFCLKPVFVAPKFGGKKIRCPHCKNPISVPVVRMAKSNDEVKAVQEKKPQNRAIQSRYKWLWLKKLVKLAIIVGIVYVGHLGYKHFQKQNKKDLKTLFSEYEDGKIENKFFIEQKIQKEDVELLKDYRFSEEPKVRILVAKCVGKLGLIKELYILEELFKDKDPKVRAAAADAFAGVRYRRAIEIIMSRLDKEKNEDVRSNMADSLRSLTGQRFHRDQKDHWKQWWKMNKGNFEVK